MRSRFRSFHPATTTTLLMCLAGAAACDNTPNEPEETAAVAGIVRNVQVNTQLFFYDDQLDQLGSLSVRVRTDGTYGPLAFATGRFFGAGTASGFTTGELAEFDVDSPDDSLTVDFDLDPVTVPLEVGNRWTYDEFDGASSSAARTVVVEITASQPGGDLPAIFTVEERTTELSSGAQDTTTYFLAAAFGGIRRSADSTVDESDELLLRLPATLGLTWSTVDFATGSPVNKRIRALVCDADACEETNDFTIAREPAGNFMSVSEIHELADQTVITVFSNIGIVDEVELSTGSSQIVSQRKLTAFTSPSGGST